MKTECSTTDDGMDIWIFSCFLELLFVISLWPISLPLSLSFLRVNLVSYVYTKCTKSVTRFSPLKPELELEKFSPQSAASR